MQKQIKLLKLFLMIFIVISLVSCKNVVNSVKGKTYANEQSASIVAFKGKIAYLMMGGMEIGEVELAAKYKNKLVYVKENIDYYYVFILEGDTLYGRYIPLYQIGYMGGIKNIEIDDSFIPLKFVK